MTQTLELQRTKYSQQAKSNLVLDWNGSTVEKSFSFGSLRSKLVAKHGRQFPPLNEDLLANTVGIAAMLLFRADSGEYLPYLQKRADGLAVFPGAFHCTASGATQPPLIKAWDGAEFSFGDVFLSDMYRELYEEIGVARSHILDLVPVALCREYLRGGKPQIFFVGLTDLSPPELKKARIEAIRRKGKSDIKEIESRAFVPRSSKELNDFLQDPKITLETLPALHYADRYATVRLAAN
jgi:8-oxo-dGTP pyrophosphatase MutT (NUDIX family)